ncbi:MAG: MBL fold metallo-hydrolase [Acidimicrobiia bacterium]|nr:MBL fold metallo-hydrolase [Acidimicrobiia bacterium]
MFDRPTLAVENEFGLPIHRTSRWIFNCYVVEGGDGHVLVDAGLPATAAAALALISGRDGSADHAVATHGHCDHLGGMPLLHNQAGTLAHLPARCADYLDGETPRVFGAKAALGFVPMYREQPFSLKAAAQFGRASTRIGYSRGETMVFRPPVASFLTDGDPVPGLEGWHVVAAAGHTDDSICYYHPDSATLLSGDAVITLGGRAWFNPEWVDAEASRATEDRLRSLEVRYLLPGHGLPIAGDVWARALAFGERPPGRGLLPRCSRRFGQWPSGGHDRRSDPT